MDASITARAMGHGEARGRAASQSRPTVSWHGWSQGDGCGHFACTSIAVERIVGFASTGYILGNCLDEVSIAVSNREILDGIRCRLAWPCCLAGRAVTIETGAGISDPVV